MKGTMTTSILILRSSILIVLLICGFMEYRTAMTRDEIIASQKEIIEANGRQIKAQEENIKIRTQSMSDDKRAIQALEQANMKLTAKAWLK